ncbi:MAG: FAD-binding oxidoreductase [Acidobacteria bacterium]|nr:MAG: FAD-binding oxidoreductase [Acidobacteriota bacterium]
MRRARDPDALAAYLEDASRALHGRADEVVWPESAGEVSELLADCCAKGIPVTVSGGGTGVTGGRVPLGGVVLATDRLRRCGPFPPARAGGEALVEVGAGVPLAELHGEAERAGWFYPPDPTEEGAYLGGTLATNASGARSFRFGPTRAWVRAVEAVLPDGRIVRLARGQSVARGGRLELPTVSGDRLVVPAPNWAPPKTRKNAAGYHPGPDAVDLLVGSEGTLAVIVKATVALRPRPPGWITGLLAFPSERQALEFVAAARRGEGRVSPASLEFLDAASLRLLARRGERVPEGAEAAVVLDEPLPRGGHAEDLLDRYAALADRHGASPESWLSGEAEDRRRLRALRHALPAAVNETVTRRGFGKLGTDTAVPPGRLPGLLERYRRILDEAGMEYVVFGHAGDDHLHVNLIPSSEHEAEAGRRLHERLLEAAVEVGGTVSAEHGIGKLRRQALARMYPPEALAAMRATKAAFDPQGILGRGTLFPP